MKRPGVGLLIHVVARLGRGKGGQSFTSHPNDTWCVIYCLELSFSAEMPNILSRNALNRRHIYDN
jgi:hypothetical protein